MRPQIESALGQEGADDIETNTKGYSIYILTLVISLVKKKYKDFSTWFWRKSYVLAINKEDHAVAGYLWHEIGSCLILLIYRAVGRIIR